MKDLLDMVSKSSGVAYDSRQVKEGMVFFALPGENVDGVKFAHTAVSNGAVAVVSSKPIEGINVPIFLVDDARYALAQASRLYYNAPDEALRVVGITGTNGKTTTALMLRDVLSSCGVIGTVSYELGDRTIVAHRTTPESSDLYGYFSEMKKATLKNAVVEYSSHAGVQHRAACVKWSGAIFTNLTRDHLDYHGTMEAYLDAKSQIFRSLNEGVPAVLNGMDPASEVLAKVTKGKVWRYGITKDCEVCATVKSMSMYGTVIDVVHPNGAFEWNTKMIGFHNVMNGLAAISMGLALGLDDGVVASRISSFDGAPGRLERINGKEISVVVDYAHTEDALRNVLRALRECKPQRIIVVFGCGGDRDKGKRAPMGRASQDGADVLYVTSDNPRTENPEMILEEVLAGIQDRANVIVEVDRRVAIHTAIKNARSGDVVLIAGKGHETEQIIGDDVIHFDDREEARIALEARND